MEFTPGEIIVIGYADKKQIKQTIERLQGMAVLIHSPDDGSFDKLSKEESRTKGNVIVVFTKLRNVSENQKPDLSHFKTEYSLIAQATIVVATFGNEAFIIKNRTGYNRKISLEELYFPILFPSTEWKSSI